MSFDYPLSQQDSFVSNLDRLREVAPDVATAFRGVRATCGCAGIRRREMMAGSSDLAGWRQGRDPS